MGALPIFDPSPMERTYPWVLDDTFTWEQRANSRVILPLNEVATTGAAAQAVLDRNLVVLRRSHERYLWKHLQPFRYDEGIFTIVHRGDGVLGLAWSVFPLIPSPKYFPGLPLKKGMPPWWNALV